MAEKKPQKFYVLHQSKYHLSFPRLGENGKPMIAKNAKGDERFQPNGDPIYSMANISFQTVVGDSRVGVKHCVYVPKNDLELQALQAQAKDYGSPILDEATFKKSLNAAAWAQEERAVRAEQDNKALTELADSQQKRIDALEKQLAEAKGRK